ncbi:hypothetical protein [Georgenia sp. MJ170]|uniref:hypothetical protein n=1 Tax=Georgenia sunbinii TaxID=3117728 RepID=UPI002F263F2E
MIYATRKFWKGAAERAIATGAQFVGLVVGVGVTAGAVDGETAEVLNAFTLDWLTIGGSFAGGAFASLVLSLARPKFVAGEPGATPEPIAPAAG